MRQIILAATLLIIISTLIFGRSAYSEVEPVFEKDLLKYINNYRIQRGRNPLVFDKGLNGIAEGHSLFMHKNNILSHSNFNKRFNISGRDLCVENVGWNWLTPESQFAAWKESKDHRAIMLQEKITVAGISRVGLYVTFFACQ
ncbi:MAG: CAP domain-containing protein [Thermodesulfovibrionales bacterium]|nr:CAP domain-containing protein [Thermodesulfovibrionales bacterium]